MKKLSTFISSAFAKASTVDKSLADKSADRHLSTRKGFTLIELLIVIAIIGALATIFMANFIGVRKIARDSQRKSNLRQIQAALELIRSDLGVYPGSLYTTHCPTSSPLVAGSPPVTYMQKIPCDPSPIGEPSYFPGPGNYYYFSPAGTTYVLAACIENTNDADPNAATHFICPTGKFYYLTNP